MATYPIRFEFYCETPAKVLKYIHNLPSTLWAIRAQTSEMGAEYIQPFTNAIQPIMNAHEVACRAASSPFCRGCNSAAVRVILTPMSFLHIVEDPFVGTWVNPVCEKGECEVRILQGVQNTMSKARMEAQTQRGSCSSTSLEVMLCNVCGKVEGVQRCGRCKVLGYCCKEHQRADWKAHRRNCVSQDNKTGQ